MPAVICLRGGTWRLCPCRLWTGTKIDGYGARHRGGRTVRVHREALEQKLGRPLRKGYLALHHCDVRNCHEPEHLYEGTHAQNNQDAVDRGRWRGPNGRPQVPEAVKSEIRSRYLAGASIKALAAEFGVGSGTVCRAVPRHLHRPPGPSDMPESLKAQIRRQYAGGGVSQRALAKQYGVVNSTIHRVLAAGGAA